jgi:two-component system sensor histidine kinase BaeS
MRLGLRRRPDPTADLRAVQRVGLAPRLFLTNLLVIVAGAGTLLTVALLFAPALFHEHLQRAHLPQLSTQIRDDVDAAFDRSLLVSLSIGVAVATLTAATISWLVARRLVEPVHQVVLVAQRLADGHYETVAPEVHLGPEFASLARSMNLLSRRLGTTEAQRRRLTADLAHQLRTPVASVAATVEALIDGVLDPDPATLAALADQTGRLHRLIADLEKVSRAEERQLVLDPTPQPLAPVAQRCLAAVHDRYRAKDVDLALDADPATPVVRIDADRIGEVMANLLDNALRHTLPGGRVSVALGPSPTVGPPSAELTVHDTGEGFPPDQAPLLFQRFHRGPDVEPGSGSGLGLTIAAAIAEAHAGSLHARSDGPGHGATFTLSLPAASTGAGPRLRRRL